jgi:hypothetical protein
MKRLACASLIALSGCGGGGGETTMATGTFTYYVVDKLNAPMQRTDYSIDLNGDAHPDNQLGNIVGALAAQNLAVQDAIDKATSDGSIVLLISVQATDLTNASDVGANLYLGAKTMMPDFSSGMGMFAVDSTQAPGNFLGKIMATKFSSNDPVTTTKPVTIHVKLPLITGTAPVDLPVNGAHIQFNTGSDPTTMKPGLINGSLQGSIKDSDVKGNIIPAVASLLTTKLNPTDLGMACTKDADCASSGHCDTGTMKCALSDATKQIGSIFDTGVDPTMCMCTDAAGVMSVANDGKITPCEVQCNMIIMNVLAPDVQIFDASGNYAPNKANTMKDSLSLGLGFTATQCAMFK